MTPMETLRKSRGYTQTKMKLLTGIDQRDYSKIESGKQEMTVQHCRQIALALETSMDYLLGLTDDPIPHVRTAQKG